MLTIIKHIPPSLHYHQASFTSVSIPGIHGAACLLPLSYRVQQWRTPPGGSSVRPGCQSVQECIHWQGRRTHLPPTWWGWGGRIHQTPHGSPPVVGDKKPWVLGLFYLKRCEGITKEGDNPEFLDYLQHKTQTYYQGAKHHVWIIFQTEDNIPIDRYKLSSYFILSA